jgi:hypothetical protein
MRIMEKARNAARIEIEYFTPDDLDRIYTINSRQRGDLGTLTRTGPLCA